MILTTTRFLLLSMLISISESAIYVLTKLNIFIVSARGVLPMASKLGIIPMSQFFGAESAKPTVRRGFCRFMRLFSKTKKRIHCQIEEYISWKSHFSASSANRQEEVLTLFVQFVHKDSISEVNLDDIQSFYTQARTQFGAITYMKALRGIFQYYYKLKQTTIRPNEITDAGVNLQSVDSIDMVESMEEKNIKSRKVGRPINLEVVQKVKRLRDQENLNFRAISVAVKRDVSQVHRYYKMDLGKYLLTQ